MRYLVYLLMRYVIAVNTNLKTMAGAIVDLVNASLVRWFFFCFTAIALTLSLLPVMYSLLLLCDPTFHFDVALCLCCFTPFILPRLCVIDVSEYDRELAPYK